MLFACHQQQVFPNTVSPNSHLFSSLVLLPESPDDFLTVNWAPLSGSQGGQSSSAWRMSECLFRIEQRQETVTVLEPKPTTANLLEPSFPLTAQHRPVRWNPVLSRTQGTESVDLTPHSRVVYIAMSRMETAAQTSTVRGREGQSALGSEEGRNVTRCRESGRASWRRGHLRWALKVG